MRRKTDAFIPQKPKPGPKKRGGPGAAASAPGGEATGGVQEDGAQQIGTPLDRASKRRALHGRPAAKPAHPSKSSPAKSAKPAKTRESKSARAITSAKRNAERKIASGSFFAIAAPGTESLVAREVSALGVTAEIVPGGVNFKGDMALLYRANLEMRVASRVLVRIATFRARTFFELERYAKDIPWQQFVTRGSAVTLRVTSSKSKLYHEGAIAERLMLSMEQKVGSVKTAAAVRDEDESDTTDHQMFVVRFVRDECVVSADSSGALLHMRGYRQAVGKAPLRETLAASLLLGADWDGSAPLLDPLCGSGTIAIEAALLARGIAPGIANADRKPRAYAFEKWPDFDRKSWTEIVDSARARITSRPGAAIVGSDRDAGAIEAAIANAARAGVQDDVAFEKRALSAATVPGDGTWIVTNPPYGVRVGTGDQRNLFAALGKLARDRAPEGRVVVLTPDATVSRHSGLKFGTLFETKNGGIAVRGLATALPRGAQTD